MTANNFYYAVTPPAGYKISGTPDEYNGKYRGEVTFKPKAGYTGSDVTATINAVTDLSNNAAGLDGTKHYIYGTEGNYTLATAENVKTNNYPDLTEVYALTLPSFITITESPLITDGGTRYYAPNTTVNLLLANGTVGYTLTSDSLTMNGDKTLADLPIELAAGNFPRRRDFSKSLEPRRRGNSPCPKLQRPRRADVPNQKLSRRPLCWRKIFRGTSAG